MRDWDMRNWDSRTGTHATRTAGLGHAELGQRYWDSFYNVKMGKIVACVLVVLHVTRGEDVLDGATGIVATRTAGLGHAELGQRDWDTRYKDSGTGTCETGTAGLGHALQGHFVFFVIRMLKKFFFAMVCNNCCY